MNIKSTGTYLPSLGSYGVQSLAAPSVSPLLEGNMSYVPGGGTLGDAPSSWGDFWLGGNGKDGSRTQGAAMPLLGAAQGIFNGWMAMKQYGLAKQQLAEGKRQFGLNYEAQRSTVNSQLEDRQRARVASNPGAYQSVGDYMGTYGIKRAG